MLRVGLGIIVCVVVAAGVVAIIMFSGRGAPYTEIIQTSSGPIRGEELTYEGKIYKAFKGIPYAAPPVGDLRFKDPQPPENWTSVRDTRIYGNICHQADGAERAREDCLTLNVFTPSLGKNGLLPVLIWIHGGAFHGGDGTDTFFGPQYLIQEDIVVITVNYRLGPLGFLSTNTSDASGNWGLKDQVAALRWVHKNIANFGGDPNQVTIYGASAGAASAHFHVFSPLSKGLFHRVIASSGSATDVWMIKSAKLTSEYSINIARLLGASEDEITDPAKRVKFLRTADPKVMCERAKEIRVKEDFSNLLVKPMPFTPVIENPSTHGAFLTEAPKKLLMEGRFTKVPMMMGVTDIEVGVVFGAIPVPVTPEHMKETEKNVSVILPDALKYPVVARDECTQVAREISDTYFDGKPLDSSNQSFANLCSDLFITGKLHAASRAHAEVSSTDAAVYNYMFSFDGQWNMVKKHLKINLPGAVHGDDSAYVFMPSLASLPNRNLPPTSPEVITKNRMVRLIGNFVKYGNPTPSVSDLIPIKWEPATADATKTMIIANELKMENEFLKTRMNLWDRLYERYTGSLAFL